MKAVIEASPSVKGMLLQQEPFTVVIAALANPDEFFVEHVMANSPTEAVENALTRHPDLKDEPYSIPAVFAGHHECLYQS